MAQSPMDLPRLHRLPFRRQPARAPASSLRRRLMVSVYCRLPTWAQDLAVRLAAPKLSLSVYAVITDARGHLLLVRHPNAGQAWGLPGGFAEAGEEPEDALVREVREELGLASTIGPLLGTRLHRRRRQLALYYRATVAGMLIPDNVEVVGWQYVPARELHGLCGEEAGFWLPLVDAPHAA